MVYKTIKYAAKKYPAVRRRANVYVPAVRQLASDVMYIKSLVNSETKYNETTTSNNFDYNGTVVALSAIVQGDGNTNRDGNRVLPRYLNIKGFVSITSATARTDPINCRAILFRYWGESPSAGSVVTPSEILSTVGSQYAPLSHLNEDIVGSRGDRVRRIEVLKNWDILLDKTGANPAMSIDCNIQMNGPGVKNKEHIQFASSATADAVSGGLYLLFISDTATATEVHYKIQSKLVFYDN